MASLLADPCPECGAQVPYQALTTHCGCGWSPFSAAPKANKYGATKVSDDGYTFDSKAEWMRYRELKLMQAARKICGLKVHPAWEIAVNEQKICRYTADFEYFQDGFPVVEDVKSDPTRKKRDYILTKKLMLAVHGIRIKEYVKP